MTFQFEPISLDTAHQYNTNNHWINNERPIDYYEMIEQFDTKNWIDKRNIPYKKIIMDDEYDLDILKKMSFLGKIARKISPLFEDEINEMAIKYEKKYPDLFCNGEKYFVRCCRVSLKYGHHGLIPYTNFKTIIESLVTCPGGHTPIYVDTDKIEFYLLPWIEINKCDEFRIFVKDKKITCISQQYMYENFHLNEENLKDKMQSIISHFTSTVINIIEPLNFSYDLVFYRDAPYFIEPNCFGKEYAAGSALFHWLNDYDKLYGKTDDIYIRYITE